MAALQYQLQSFHLQPPSAQAVQAVSGMTGIPGMTSPFLVPPLLEGQPVSAVPPGVRLLPPPFAFCPHPQFPLSA